jgi:hypothetical protein
MNAGADLMKIPDMLHFQDHEACREGIINAFTAALFLF